MKISYQREMKRNYLIVEAEPAESIPFEQKMLEQNQIDGLLRFQVRKKDLDTRFFYEITSKQPLTRMLENQPVQAEQIRALVFGIARALDHMEQYLLNENSVLLEPEYLYVEPENWKIWLCLVPGLERDFPEDYSLFLEYLLGKVDHRDKESVVLAYGLYQETRKDNYGMADILRLAEQKLKVSESGQDWEAENLADSSFMERMETSAEERAQIQQRSMERQGRFQGKQDAEMDWKPGMVRARQIQTDFSSQATGLFGKWKQKRKERKEEKQRELEQEMEMPWETMFAGNEAANRPEVQGNYGGEERWNNNRIVSGKAAPTSFQSSDTALLNPESAEQMVNQRRLKALDVGEEDIAIAYYPFIIGKQENLVDYVLARETVSRLHLRIDQKDERYYVQDLNSTNGTLVNGRMLENNEMMEIWVGTEISIAGVRYRFE